MRLYFRLFVASCNALSCCENSVDKQEDGQAQSRLLATRKPMWMLLCPIGFSDPVGRTAGSRQAEPGPAAHHAQRACAVGFPARSVHRRALVAVAPAVRDPLVHVPDRVMDAERVGRERSRRCGSLVVPGTPASVAVRVSRARRRLPRDISPRCPREPCTPTPPRSSAGTAFRSPRDNQSPYVCASSKVTRITGRSPRPKPMSLTPAPARASRGACVPLGECGLVPGDGKRSRDGDGPHRCFVGVTTPLQVTHPECPGRHHHQFRAFLAVLDHRTGLDRLRGLALHGLPMRGIPFSSKRHLVRQKKTCDGKPGSRGQRFPPGEYVVLHHSFLHGRSEVAALCRSTIPTPTGTRQRH